MFEGLVVAILVLFVVWSIIVHMRLGQLEDSVKRIIQIQNYLGKR